MATVDLSKMVTSEAVWGYLQGRYPESKPLRHALSCGCGKSELLDFARFYRSVSLAPTGPSIVLGLDFAQSQEKSEMKHILKNWSFKSAHEGDIDFDDIANSLTRKHPIAFARGERAGKMEGYVVLHASLIQKAALCGLWDAAPPLGNPFNCGAGGRSNAIQVHADKDFALWQAWAKHVRRADWPKKGHGKATFKVNLLEI